jgi:hypothetical protein
LNSEKTMHNEKKPNISKKCKNKGEKNSSIMVFFHIMKC